MSKGEKRPDSTTGMIHTELMAAQLQLDCVRANAGDPAGVTSFRVALKSLPSMCIVVVMGTNNGVSSIQPSSLTKD
ncbi:hypothetical protein MGYG_07141 [Nannizzia gypsea CBS 118893]|uniref:Uncharacterized protein n=1 Tax=Arthroderma gypseum (strain ATCC MYA-4604 / CBS 118893) TaxID=535722 RepID=E4V269_ARTGP|nr:hypothetical protein MGYG_07141 [Nannizzia gypsea CBS 118893]EFR04134.1 hypothetical protein MGYG_07141 [Nannizzia gypsea CBS 118893]